jgi:hypothetical protein
MFRFMFAIVLALVAFSANAAVSVVKHPLVNPYTINWALYLYEQPMVVNYFGFNCTLSSENALSPVLVNTYGAGATTATCDQAGFEVPDRNDPDSRASGLPTTITINGQEFDNCYLIQVVFDQGTNSGWQAFNCF